MKLIIITPNSFPAEDAGALRDDAFSQLFQALGYSVYALSRGRQSAAGEYRGTGYESLYRESRSKLHKVWNWLTAAADFRRAFRRYLARFGAPDVIYLGHDDNRIVRFVQRYAARRDIPLLYNACEWYSPCEFRLGKWSRVYLSNDYRNRRLLRPPARVIAISRYLADYFSGRGMAVLRVPVILDMRQIDGCVEENGDRVNLVYAGSPGGKDSLRPLLLALLSLPEPARARLRVHIIGLDPAQLAAHCGLDKTRLAALSDTLTAYGRLPHGEVSRLLKEMDFSVLLRPAQERYAKAGFPTKVVEAMAHGVAMLCNLSSDLSEYLVDGENALIAADEGVDAVRAALLRAAALPGEEILRLRRAARDLAERAFDVRCYLADMERFLSEAAKK